jgi:hypothetical protein
MGWRDRERERKGIDESVEKEGSKKKKKKKDWWDCNEKGHEKRGKGVERFKKQARREKERSLSKERP